MSEILTDAGLADLLDYYREDGPEDNVHVADTIVKHYATLRARCEELTQNVHEWSRQNNELASIAAKAESERDAALKAIEGLFGLIESGYLVRNISHDGEPGWAMKQLSAVMILKRAAILVHPEESRALAGEKGGA